MEADFGGYATKAGLKCTDGRTIMPEAFREMDGMQVPLVWQHGHSSPDNVLGHAVLEAREDGVYTYGFFNDTPAAGVSRALLEHKDIDHLSIYANQLVERSKQVFHGVIREVSLVLSGANPGAKIDFVRIAHSDGDIETLDDEAIIFTDEVIEHAAQDAEDVADKGADEASEGDATLQDVYDSLDANQKNLLHYMVGAALEGDHQPSASHSDSETEGDLTHKEGTDADMSRTNVFENQKKDGDTSGEGHVLTHDAIRGIVADAERRGSLRAAVEDYALQHGIDDIDVLFPTARNIDQTPEFLSRRVEWVAGVLNGTRKNPFSRIRTRNADITMDEARAKGYIKGNMKKEEFFSVAARTTAPTTIYKKQKLDRDDMIDINDFDVVAWLKAEMRLMLDEEIARAILLGDGRDVDDEDKIKDPSAATDGVGIRSILNEHQLYVTHIPIHFDGTAQQWNSVIETVMRNRRFYKGSGTPTLYTTNQNLVEMLLTKDNYGRRLYNSQAELATALMVSDIVQVEVMDQYPDLVGIIVNLSDYTVGTDRGGEVNFFDFFDIDYNQYKYLYESRMSGALTKLKSALILTKAGAGDALAAPTKPTYDDATGTITIPTDTDSDYSVDGTPIADGATHVVAVGDAATVTATPSSGFYYAEDYDTQWTFRRRA